MQNKKLVDAITSREENFAQWYTDLCVKAELMDYSDVGGFIIYRPYGYAIWESIQGFLDKEFKLTGHENVYMPLVIPESLFQKEKDHVDGFAPETAMMTSSSGKDNMDEKLIIRPTSEVLFANHYSKTISSHRDLPKLYNQWCNVVRWEKTTRPFLRGKEFLWQEGHTAHATAEEAMDETLQMLNIYDRLGKELLAIPFVKGKKTESEKFAGAVETHTIEALMYDKKALQSGTSHYFGQGFAKAFDITYQNKESKTEHVYQASFGVSTRLIGAVIMVHGDDDGLVLPPYVAQTQVMIIPIQDKKPGVLEAVDKLENELKALDIRVKADRSNRSPGWKFSEYEMKGVPLRIEVGPRDLANGTVTLVTRYNREKHTVKLEDVATTVPIMLKDIHEAMYNKALKHLEDNTYEAKTYDEFKKYLDLGGFIALSVSDEAEEIIKEETGATARVILDQELITEKCPVTNLEAKQTILFARAY